MASKTPVWLVVGASSGFGQSITQDALKRGHKVIAASRRPDAMAHLKDAGATIMAIDVMSSEQVLADKVKEAVDVYGYITHLVNAVGFSLGGPNEAINDELATRELLTNVLGTMKMCRLLTPYFRKQKYGVIANFGSLGSWNGAPGMSHYAATKWAVSGFTESLRPELEPFGIKVTVIEPGYFRTGFLNDGHVVWAADRMKDVYEGTPADQYRDLADQYNNNQPGDVNKAGPIIVDLLTETGVAKGRKIPMRLVLGKDCFDVVDGKLKETKELIEKWKQVSVSTDHDQ
ncbi:short chain dehydrogenase domain-containing protein [Sarocladium implicatum]|nr:short chain dehydrogenase domain-containing protein [Sarocladium implicatum]